MAFLRGIRLRGFKTFAQATELVFKPGVTVIIGPNGSGKSNLADAVLWALGEQSPSALRGRSMQDVIFAGSDSHGPSASAEVTLLFENSSGAFPGGFSEVEITRRLSRDGHSEYLVNGVPRRLLDVHELCAAVGLGREMHSVVSQGRVEEILSSSPSSRRALLEEAAGLTLYKKRKERALAKLERVSADLVRLSDLEREIRAMLRPLKQQVNQAEIHFQLTEQIARLETILLMQDLLKGESSLRAVEEELKRVLGEKSARETQLDSLRLEREREERSFTETLNEREARSAFLTRMESESRRLVERHEDLLRCVQRWEQEIERLQRNRNAEFDSLQRAERELRAERARAECVERRLARVQEAGHKVAAGVVGLAPELERVLAAEERQKDLILDVEARCSRERQRAELLDREHRQMSRRLLEAGERVGAARREVANLTERLAELGEQVARLEVEFQQKSIAAEEARRRFGETRTTLHETRRALRQEEEELTSLQMRLRLLKEAIQRREGLPSGAKALLETKSSAKLLIDQIEVTPGFERAVVAALGLLSQAVVVSDDAPFLLLGSVEGEIEILRLPAEAPKRGDDKQELCGDHLPAPGEEANRPLTRRSERGPWCLWDVIRCAPELKALLTQVLPRVVIVDTDVGFSAEDSELQALKAAVVTKSGEIILGPWHAARRSAPSAESLWAARRALASVEEAAAAHRERIAFLRREVAGCQKQLKDAQAAYELLEREVSQVQAEISRAQDEIRSLKRLLADAKERLGRAEVEKETLSGSLANVVTALEESRQAAQIAENESRLLRDGLRKEQEAAEAARLRMKQLERKREQAGLLEVRLREQLRAITGEILRLEKATYASRRRITVLDAHISWLQAVLPEARKLCDVLGSLTEFVSRARNTARVQFERVRSSSLAFAETLRSLTERESNLQAERSALEAEVVALQVERARLADALAITRGKLADLREKHLAPRSVSVEDAQNADSEQVKEALARAVRKRDALGPINPLADREYAELADRLEFLLEQKKDLEGSIAELRRIVRDLDNHIASVFTDFFGRARQNFQELVETLFPGGKGELRLQSADEGSVEASADGVDSGIEIIIRLPNRTPRTLLLLSGGEKALAAIAFLFALFLARPCPFYILDEVEAALDDINIGRFLSLIRRYQDRTQFLIITHQRRTMEVADTVYGVAMGQDGISRVLSRRLNRGLSPVGAAGSSVVREQARS